MKNNCKSFSSNALRDGFTLIELLVVMGIIMLLAAIATPAIFKALESGKKNQALTEVKSIETAVKAYFNDYAKFPHGSGQAADYGYGTLAARDNLELMNVLRAVDGVGNVNHVNNPRRIVYLEVPDYALQGGNPGSEANKNFIDPWKQQYEITVDTGFDDQCTLSRGGYVPGSPIRRTVVVWSTGPEQPPPNPITKDDIKSW